MNRNESAPQPSVPWWRLPIVWLVIGGPAAVVVAGIITAVIAVRQADPVLSTQDAVAAAEPAQQARNHAATPGR